MGGDDIDEENKKKTKKSDTLKKIIKFIMNFRKYMIIVGIVAIIMVLLAGFVYIITLDDGTYDEEDKSNTPYMTFSTYVQGVKFGVNGINFEYKEIDQFGNETISTKTSKEMAQIIWDTLIKEKSNVNQYIDSAEELERLMRAEIVTQFPKLDKNVDLNGTVEFERHKTDGTSTILKYKDIATFNKYIEEKNLDIVNYFTLDGDGNVLIGIVDETIEELISNDSEMILSDYTDTLSDENKIIGGTYKKITYNVLSKSIPYKSIVSKYTMPFQYLWSLIVVGGDKDVGLELAELVENSQIIVSIYDNVTTTVNTTIDTYNRGKKMNVSATAKAVSNYGDTNEKSDRWDPVEEWQETDEYEIKHVFTYKNNTAIVDVKKADVWITDYSKEYMYQSSQQTLEETNEKSLEDTEYINDNDNPVKSEKGDGTDLLNYDKFKDKLSDLKDDAKKPLKKDYAETKYDVNGVPITYSISSDIISCKAEYYKHNVNRQRKNINEEFVQKYVAGNVVNNPKVEKNTGEKNFVTILCAGEHDSAMKNITRIASSWLFEMLENNPDTVNMVDLTKFLINKVLDKELYKNLDVDFESIYGVNSEEFESFLSVGDFRVNDKTSFITDLEKLKTAFSGYSNSGKLIEHAQDFLDMQEKYKVNALFAAAVSIAETGAGNAGNAIKVANQGNSVGAKPGQCWNNWFNIKASSEPYGIVFNGEGKSHYKIYNSVADSIDNFGYNIAQGSYYYKQGKYTVNEIGHVYCPNSPAYPTQGDDWVKHTLTYINNFYSAVGITVGAPTGGTADEKLKHLFPNGLPTNQSECLNYITTAPIALTSKDGSKMTGNISIHKGLVKDVQKVFQTAQDSGFKVYEAYGYSYREMNNGGSGKLSHHSYGVAIDINVNENYSHRGSTIYAGKFWDPFKSEFSIPRDGTLVKAFESIGWKWGGNWSGNYQDYMHFSYTGK